MFKFFLIKLIENSFFFYKDDELLDFYDELICESNFGHKTIKTVIKEVFDKYQMADLSDERQKLKTLLNRFVEKFINCQGACLKIILK